MNLVESRAYRILEAFTNLLLLNFMWLIFSLPLVTLYPATAAMFAVTREWIKDRDPSLTSTFIYFFRRAFWQGIGVGLLWTFFGGLLLINFSILGYMPNFIRVPLQVIFLVILIVYAGASVYVFPVMANYVVSWTMVLRSSILFALSQLLTTLGGMLVVVFAVTLAILFPLALPLLGSIIAYSLTWLCLRAFRRVEALQSEMRN